MHSVISGVAVCSAIGNSHYKTFGRRRFRLRGECEYVLAKDLSEKFVILQDKKQCGKGKGKGKGKATCTNAVTVKIQGMEIYLRRGGNVQVNGTDIILPYANQGMENYTCADTEEFGHEHFYPILFSVLWHAC
jgi:hypothetical protein